MKTMELFKSIKSHLVNTFRRIEAEFIRGDRIHREIESRKESARMSAIGISMNLK